jgi:hypothetical protein
MCWTKCEAFICRSDVLRSTVSCSNAFNDGFQLSDRAGSAFLGIGVYSAIPLGVASQVQP